MMLQASWFRLQCFANWSHWERTALTLGLAALFLVGYFGVGLNTDPARALDLSSSLDERIPFVAETVWVYIWIFPAALIPLFTVRSRQLFRRLSFAYASVIILSLICFMLWPVTSNGLRVDVAALDPGRFSDWGVKLLYSIDPPYNLFPSLHLSIATLAACSAGKARRFYGVITFVGVGMVLVSISTVKQHFVLDGLAGLVLALIIYMIILRPYRRPADGSAAYSWRGPAAFLVLQVLVYVGLFIVFVQCS
ncbi:MAG: phosphatase PAP2 family protein [Gammaproteobacteria bacterium]